jgi:hypothetical protein
MQSVDTGKDLYVFTQFYYTNPRPDLVVSFMNYIIKIKLNDNQNTQRHLIPLMGEIFKANDDKIKQWFQSIEDITDKDIYVFCQALYWSSLPNAKEQITILLKQTHNRDLVNGVNSMISKYNPFDMHTIKVTTPAQLDMIWNCFFATGDTEYVRKIICLCDENMSDVNSVSIYSAARISLASISKTHEDVYRICQEEFKKGNSKRKEGLKSIIKT